MNNGNFSFTCMLCGVSEYIIRKGHARDNTTLIPLECASCGLVTLSSHTHIDDDFYAKSRMHDLQPCDPALELQQSAEDTERRYKQWKHLLAGKHVLDYGCGAGGFLLKARESAASVTGIEPELRLQEHFAKVRLPVYTSYECLPKDTPFDVVTMFHVLEHIAQPIDILRKIRNGGQTLIVEVPSASDALLTLYESKAFSEFTYWSCHLYLYTPDNLKTLLERAGYKTKEMIQYQRYPLTNHLYWLSKGLPGGQHVLGEAFSEKTCTLYADDLARQGKCDTIIGVFEL